MAGNKDVTMGRKDRKEGFLEAKGNELGKSDPKMEREKWGRAKRTWTRIKE